LSEDIIREAINIRRMINSLEIEIDTSYGSVTRHLDDTKKDLVRTLNALTLAQANNNQDELSKAALKVVQLYTILASDGAISEETEAVVGKYNSLVNDYNSLDRRYKELREKKDREIAELQGKVNEAFHAKGIAEGKFTVISEKYDRLIQALREAAARGTV